MNAASAWTLGFDDGTSGINLKTNTNYVWPVRDRQ